MKWVSQNTPMDSQFMVFTKEIAPGMAKANEWFPVVAKRKSLLAAFGAEWLDAGKFDQIVLNWCDMMVCREKSSACIEGVALEKDLDFSHIYFSKNCCVELIASLKESETYLSIYDKWGIHVFERIK